jgi:hypothetical protein
MRMLKQQIAEVDREPQIFPGKLRAYIPVNRGLNAKADGVIAIDAQSRRTEKDLVRVCSGHSEAVLCEPLRAFAHQFSEQTPVPFVCFFAPLRRTVAIDKAVVEDVWTLVTVVLVKVCGGSGTPPPVPTPIPTPTPNSRATLTITGASGSFTSSAPVDLTITH